MCDRFEKKDRFVHVIFFTYQVLPPSVAIASTTSCDEKDQDEVCRKFISVVVVSKRSLCPKKYVWGKKSVQNKEGKLGKCVSLEKTWKLSLNSSVVHSLMFAYVILCVSSFHVFNPSQNFDDRSRLSNIMILPSIKLSLQKRM